MGVLVLPMSFCENGVFEILLKCPYFVPKMFFLQIEPVFLPRLKMAELEHPNYYLCNALDPFALPLRKNGNEHVLGRGEACHRHKL
jgi:hypothetical protein